MRVLLFHGYLLRGTGSNVYNAELAQALAAQGHDVHLLCQDREAADLGWVDRVGDWESGELRLRPTKAEGDVSRSGRGGITVYRPDIAGLLPVYVYDRYAGFEVKTYPELSDEELERYLSRNVAAVQEVSDRVGGFDAALANHLVMGPVILARAGVRFAAKIHGSDLSYTVRPHPERFVPYAREGMEAAAAALVGSRHTAEDLWRTVPLPDLPEKTRLGPPGLDPDQFAPRDREAANERLVELVADLRGRPEGGGEGTTTTFARDTDAVAAALEWFARAPAERVIYVGKLLINKGVDLLLAAWPLVVDRHPQARLLLAGFGAFAEPAERLWRALTSGDLEAARRLAAAAEEDGRPRRLRLLSEFLAAPPADYQEMCAAAADSLRVSGRLEHPEVGVAVPAAAALVMPSTFPEAFGMVAAEAAACGVLPVSAAHSGMAEVSARLAEALDPEIGPLLSFDPAADPVRAIAARVNAWLELAPDRRAQAARQLRSRAVELWSWQGVAQAVIDASRGRLEQQSRPL